MECIKVLYLLSLLNLPRFAGADHSIPSHEGENSLEDEYAARGAVPNDLALDLIHKFEDTGSMDDPCSAIISMPEDHPSHVICRHNLALTLWTCSKETGSREDIQIAFDSMMQSAPQGGIILFTTRFPVTWGDAP